MSTYLNGWGSLICRISIIMEMMPFGLIKYSMTKVMFINITLKQSKPPLYLMFLLILFHHYGEEFVINAK